MCEQSKPSKSSGCHGSVLDWLSGAPTPGSEEGRLHELTRGMDASGHNKPSVNDSSTKTGSVAELGVWSRSSAATSSKKLTRKMVGGWAECGHVSRHGEHPDARIGNERRWC